MTQLNQFRVDNHDVDKALDILKKYASKYQASYFISKEYGKDSGKPHLQGWVRHSATDNTFRQAFSRHYSTLGTHEKCFTKVKDPDVYYSYIISNDFKPHITSVSDSNVITNYTQDKFNELKKLKPFVVPTKKSKQSHYDDSYQQIEKSCVVDGKILYHKLHSEYLRIFRPKSINKFKLHDSCLAIAISLEQKYPNNTYATNKTLRETEAIADGLFDHPLEKWEP